MKKIWPTRDKLIAGIIFGAATCLTGGFIIHMAVAATISSMATSVTLMALPSLFTAGFAIGFLYGHNIPYINDIEKSVEKFNTVSNAEQIQQEEPKEASLSLA